MLTEDCSVVAASWCRCVCCRCCCCSVTDSVRSEQRQLRLAPFREAGFRLVAAVVLEPEPVLAKRLTRRDSRPLLLPCLDDLLDVQGERVLGV